MNDKQLLEAMEELSSNERGRLGMFLRDELGRSRSWYFFSEEGRGRRAFIGLPFPDNNTGWQISGGNFCDLWPNPIASHVVNHCWPDFRYDYATTFIKHGWRGGVK